MVLHRIAVKIAFFINGFIYANWVSRLPRIQDHYGADNGTIGLVLLATSVGAVGAMPFTGWVIIKNGSRRITLFSAFMYCAIVPAIPFMPGIIGLMVLFLLMGVITGMLDVAMNAQAVMVEREYNKPIMTSFHAFFSIGMAIGAWAGSLFAESDFDLSIHFTSMVILALIAVVWAGRNLIHDQPDASHHDDGPLFRLPTRSMITIGIIAFCCMMGEGAMGDWSVNYMENFTTASKALAPVALSAFATAMTIGRLFGDKARSRWGDGKLIIMGGLLSIAGLTLSLTLPNPYIAISGFFCVGVGLATIVPIAYSLAGNAKDLPSGVGLAMVTTVGYSGFLFGPPIIGFLANWKSLRMALVLVVCLLLVMTVLGFQFKARKKSNT